MTSKLPYEKKFQEKFRIMFEICVPDKKVQGK
jgi:hypothetical protein